MENKASNNVKRFLLLFALGVAYGFMYVMPYMKSSFYDQMIAAMGVTNEQLGYLITYYTAALTLSYIPGGWVADKFKPKMVVTVSIFGQAALSFLFMVTYQNYTMACIIWAAMAFTGGFAFWPALFKGIRLCGSDEEQGRIFGIFEALNGLASLALSFIMLFIMAAVGGSDLVSGFKSALMYMGILSAVSGFLVLFLMPNDAAYGVSEEEAKKKITKEEFIATFKMPGVWIISLLLWNYVTASAVSSYLTPYSTSVLGLSATLAATVGTLRYYGCRMIGGPLGGVLADNVFKSVSKEQMLAAVAVIITFGIFLFLPTGLNQYVISMLLLLAGTAMFLIKGTIFSPQAEYGIPTQVSGTAVAIATLIGYLPDFFVHSMFGSWIDAAGDSQELIVAAYNKIIMYGVATSAVCFVVSFFGLKLAKKVAAANAANA